MKSVLLLICGSVFLQSFVFGQSPLTNYGKLNGVNQKKLENYVTEAIEGFRKIMPTGDDELNYPVMDPYEIKEVSWNYVDESGNNKYNLNLFSKKVTLIKGLSKFELIGVDVSAEDMSLNIGFNFENLTAEFPYKLDGHIHKNILPIYGEGIVELYSRTQFLAVIVNLDVVQKHVVVDEVKIYRGNDDIKIRATGLMDLAEPFANHILDGILERIASEYGYQALKNFVRNLVEEAIGGMKISEFFEYIDHFVKKNNNE